ncbi:DUF2262 domain-containing protein [Bacillus sp. FJAT-49705]|uniref:DUF2262 domain-containing protein n=1 Tax=Cytobacillus citreus TaxID=2833586 RepID=A0ABS5NX87_9BACI|nr:DUF2262 domain-containing protein [Cytobacillus citreus]MBS4192440.1 DUF2262 domain-containing protein [Cytobacillus citreus]
MSKTSERSRFENRFTENVIEVAAVTGALGIGAGRAGGDIMWNASINLIAWKNMHSNEPVIKEELRLEWLVDDKEWEQSRDILRMNTVVKLQVRRAEKSLMLVKVLETTYRDEELEMILQESMKPVFYNDEVLGTFELDKSIKVFEKNISWAREEGSLYFDWDEDENMMKSALETTYILFKDQDEWNQKIRKYASEELVELANEWLQDNDEAEIDEITKEMFMNFMELSSISVYPDGDFEMFFFDGDMFWGHSIIVNGNINGDFTSVEIAG